MSVTQAEKGRLQKKVAKYLWQLRDEMWLTRWNIDVLVTEYPGESHTTHASIIPTNARHQADIEIAVGIAETGGPTLRHVLVHELLHLYHRDSADQVRLGLIKELATSAYELFWELYRQSIELMIDDMANAWSETLSLPDWPSEA